MNNENTQYQFAPAAPDTIEHLPSHHCTPVAPQSVLWAIHIQGPDDLFAMPSKEAAESHVEILNKEFNARKIEGGENYPTINVAVIPWSGSTESHAKNMKEHLEDVA